MDKNRESHVKGALKEIILRLIDSKEKLHGYATIQMIRSKFGVYLGPSTVYPMLEKLKSEGLIEGSWSMHAKRPVILYSLTSKGKTELESLTQDLKFVLQALVLTKT